MTVQVYSEKNGKFDVSPLFFTDQDYSLYSDLLLSTKPDRVVIVYDLKKVSHKEQLTPLSCQCFIPLTT